VRGTFGVGYAGHCAATDAVRVAASALTIAARRTISIAIVADYNVAPNPSP
jgi:hypothetical protein